MISSADSELVEAQCTFVDAAKRAGVRLRLGDLRMHEHTPFLEIAAKHETIIFIDGDDMVRGELIHDPEQGWIGHVDWSTQDIWESYPPAVAARR